MIIIKRCLILLCCFVIAIDDGESSFNHLFSSCFQCPFFVILIVAYTIAFLLFSSFFHFSFFFSSSFFVIFSFSPSSPSFLSFFFFLPSSRLVLLFLRSFSLLLFLSSKGILCTANRISPYNVFDFRSTQNFNLRNSSVLKAGRYSIMSIQ